MAQTNDNSIDMELREEIQWSTTINDLNDDVLIEIFSYFSLSDRLVLSWVNTKWRQTIDMSYKGLKRIDFQRSGRIKENLLPQKLFYTLVEKCCNVRHINFRVMKCHRRHSQTLKDILEAIVNNCSHLESIDFGHIFEDNSWLNTVIIENIHYFRKLKKIISYNISEESLNCIISSVNLEIIDIGGNSKCKKLDFKSLGPKVRELILTYSGIYKFNILKDLSQGNGPLLEDLTLDIRDKEVLTFICKNLKNLKKLEINLFSLNSDFKHFLNLTQLKSLSIHCEHRKGQIQRKDMTDLFGALKYSRISDLRISLSSEHRNNNSITDRSVHQLVINCPLLRKLDLINCFRITNETVELFIQRANSLPEEEFTLDLINSGISTESLSEELPNNLKFIAFTHSTASDRLNQFARF